MTKNPPRVALYVRISTNDSKQDLSNQTSELVRYAKRMGWTRTYTFEDRASGAATKRPGLEELMQAAAERKFDLLLVTDLSRLTRGGPASAFVFIERLKKCGVHFWSMREEHFRTAGHAGELLIAVAAYLAKQERELLQARIRAGLDRAKAQGKHCGRPRRVVDRDRVQRLFGLGWSARQIAKVVKVGKSTVQRILADKNPMEALTGSSS